MYKNYIKLALRVLVKKKFFTFITLFGISFTLMVLMILVSFLQTEFGERPPLSHQEKLVLLGNITLSRQFYDTIAIVDTVLISGVERFDTTFQYKKKGANFSSNAFGRKVLKDYFEDLESTQNTTIFNSSSVFDVFINQSKIQVGVNYCDPNFWDVFDFSFIEGRPFDVSEMEQELPVAVISARFAKKYFGRQRDVLNQMIKIDKYQYQVIGLVESPGVSTEFLISDVFIPYSQLAMDKDGESFYFGGFNMALLAANSVDQTKEAITTATSKIPTDKNKKYNELEIVPTTFKEKYAAELYDKDTPSESLSFMKWVLYGLVSFFIMLPTLNLVNLNISRIMDRSSEIGVRKAFGASQKDIISQFVFENIIQTMIGGILGLILTMIVIHLINDAQILNTVRLTMDLNFFGYSLIITVIFGILSGLIPAWRISKLQIVNALKANQL